MSRIGSWSVSMLGSDELSLSISDGVPNGSIGHGSWESWKADSFCDDVLAEF